MELKRNIFLAGLLLSLFLTGISYAIKPIEWKVKDSTHFLVYHIGDEEFASAVIVKAESYFEKITRDIGYTRYSNFWLWEGRCRIWIFPDQMRYIQFSGSPSWSRGCAYYKKREIGTFQGSSRFLEEVLPHELTHVIFREAAGLGRNVPLWLDEGIAQYEEGGNLTRSKGIMREAFKKGHYIPAKSIMQMNGSALRASSSGLVTLFYAQSISLLDYLLKKHGPSRFADLCYHLKNGEALDDALSSAYFSYGSFQEFFDDWLTHGLKGKE